MFPIKIKSGMTINSGEEANVNVSDANRDHAEFQPFRKAIPKNPTTNIVNATGSLINNISNIATMPIRPA
jgi:hypothetical protein